MWSQSNAVYFCRSCRKGFFKNVTGNDACEPCLAGTFTDTTGTAECAICPPNTYTTSTATTTCVNCLENEFSLEGSTSQDACLCVEGFYRPNNLCTECPVGTYRNITHATLNTATCTSCPHGMYTQDIGSTSSSS
jgi:hypothetical protein